jgi:hypothetical protein
MPADLIRAFDWRALRPSDKGGCIRSLLMFVLQL